MFEEALIVKLFAQVGKTVGPLVKVRLVNLEYVSREYHLSSFACACDDGLHLVRGQILGLIYDAVGIDETPAADEGERLDHKLFTLHHFVNSLGLLAARTELCADYIEIILKRLEEGCHLLCLVARQKADVLVRQDDGRTGHDDLVILVCKLHGRGYGYECLSGPGSACQRNQRNLLVQTGVYGEFLLIIARLDSIGGERLHQDDLVYVGVIAGAYYIAAMPDFISLVSLGFGRSDAPP